MDKCVGTEETVWDNAGHSLRTLDTVPRAKVTLGKPAGRFLKDFIHPQPRLQCCAKLPVILDMPGSKVRKHFETMKNVGSVPGFPAQFRGSAIHVLCSTKEFPPAQEAEQLGGFAT